MWLNFVTFVPFLILFSAGDEERIPQRVAMVKTYKCGTSTLQVRVAFHAIQAYSSLKRILFKYAMNHNLTIALPPRRPSITSKNFKY